MTPERKSALQTALQQVNDRFAPEGHLVDFENEEAKRDWYKFGSITALADQLERGTVVDPEMLIVAAKTLRKLSEKTERAALARRQQYLRDSQLHTEAGYYHRRPDGVGASELVEAAAVRHGFTDVRGVYKAIKKYISHIGDDRSKY